MPLGSKNNSNSTFLKVVNAKIAQTVPEGTEGAVERELKAGKRKGQSTYELLHDFVAGKIVGGGIVSNEYGKTVHIKLADSDSSFILQLPWNSGLRDQFAKRVPNIDVEKPIEFSCFPDKATEKPVLLLKQGNENVPFKFTREHPNGLPEWKKIKKMGEETWDRDDYDEFLYNVVEEFFEQFEGDEPPVGQENNDLDEEGEQEEESEEETSEKEDSSVPF